MRRSRFTDNEILHLLYEASTGVSAAEICRTAHISLRTLYRWRRRFGSLNELPRMPGFAGLSAICAIACAMPTRRRRRHRCWPCPARFARAGNSRRFAARRRNAAAP